MAEHEIEEYRGRSKLAPHQELIAEMRAKNWPYQKIADYLLEHFKITTCYSSLYSFCELRGIKKRAINYIDIGIKR